MSRARLRGNTRSFAFTRRHSQASMYFFGVNPRRFRVLRDAGAGEYASHLYTPLETSIFAKSNFASNSEISSLPSREDLLPILSRSCSRSEMSYYYVPRPPLRGTCYVPTECAVPQPPEVYYQPPPQAYCTPTPPVDYVYQSAPVTYRYQPPAEVHYYQPPPQAYCTVTPPIDYVYQAPPVTYRYQPPAQVHQYQPPMVRVQ